MSITLNHPYGSVSVYDNYIISVFNEGITVTPETNDTILNLIKPYFPNKKYVYIANRKYSYAVDPAVYSHISKNENLKGIAVVSSNRIALNNAELERLFIDKPFNVFYTIEEAEKWAQELAEKDL